MPCRIKEKNGFEISGTVTSSFPDFSVRRFLPAALGTYLRSSMARMTLRRVLGATTSGRLKTRDTVAVETPARLATAWILATEDSAIARDIIEDKVDYFVVELHFC